jgi:large conductance mechanosensitive channel
MLQEFKAFAMKGNVIDLAVAVVIGAAFGKIVSSLVDNLITPLVGIFMGGVDFTELSYTVGEAVFGYGAFIQSVIDFTIVAFVIFMVIKAINKAKGPEEEKEAAPAGPTQVELLMEIRDTLKR